MAQGQRSRDALINVELLAHRAVFDCSLPLAAMFAWLPPSSSDLTERKALFRHLLLQIGGANIANPPPMLCASALSLIQRGAVEIATLESRAVHLSHLEQTDDVFVRPQP
jgi:hypothetical protein